MGSTWLLGGLAHRERPPVHMCLVPENVLNAPSSPSPGGCVFLPTDSVSVCELSLLVGVFSGGGFFLQVWLALCGQGRHISWGSQKQWVSQVGLISRGHLLHVGLQVPCHGGLDLWDPHLRLERRTEGEKRGLSQKPQRKAEQEQGEGMAQGPLSAEKGQKQDT